MNRAFEKELSRALATELDTAAPKTLLRRCRAFVLSNSTFSWWGQWLAGVPGRCVIAPDRWYANGKKTALYDHDWTLIPTK